MHDLCIGQRLPLPLIGVIKKVVNLESSEFMVMEAMEVLRDPGLP